MFKPIKTPEHTYKTVVCQGKYYVYSASGSPESQAETFPFKYYLLNGCVGDWTWDLLHVKQMLYGQATAFQPQPFLFSRGDMRRHWSQWMESFNGSALFGRGGKRIFFWKEQYHLGLLSLQQQQLKLPDTLVEMGIAHCQACTPATDSLAREGLTWRNGKAQAALMSYKKWQVHISVTLWYLRGNSMVKAGFTTEFLPTCASFMAMSQCDALNSCVMPLMRPGLFSFSR